MFGASTKSKKNKHKNKNEKTFDIKNDNQIIQKCSKYQSFLFPAIIPSVKRIVVFGDIHGDLNLTIDLLTLSGLAVFNNNVITWTGKDAVLVQIGDQIDRCRPIKDMATNQFIKKCTDKNVTYNDEKSDVVIMKLFNDLNKQAQVYNGKVISLLGNHELLNAQGIMDFVSLEGLREFDKNNNHHSGLDGRKNAFLPGNELGTLLGCTRMQSVIIGTNLFVHAGIIDDFIAKYKVTGYSKLDQLNNAVRRWLLGLILTDTEHQYINDVLQMNNESPFWSRVLGKLDSNIDINDASCRNNITNVLNILHIGHIIIGHTPQYPSNEGINSTCSNIIWRVDTGSSNAFHNFDKNELLTGKKSFHRRTQYLEILNDTEYYVCDSNACKRKL